jgi:polyketide synthase PksN
MEKNNLNLIRDWIKEKKSEHTHLNSPAHSDDSLVITGVSGFFPGCMDVGSFWDSIDKDESLITTIPRFDWRKHYAPTEQPGKMRTKWGGFIPDIASFDARFFNILPSQANEMDPRQRLLLTSTWYTLEDAGIDPVSLRQSNTGVFIGCESNEYAQLMRNKGIAVTGLLNDADSMLANRISYYFDFSGASEYTNTMCSSFAVALHRAITSLRAGQIDRAIVGAANIALLPEPFIILSQEGLLSTQNTVKSFGQDGNGYLRSEGAGTILIEKLSAAKRERRHIYATIKHTSVNYNGQGGMSIAAPNTKAHTHLIKSCYQEAKIDPRQLTYIEAQGMGLPVADIAEWTAINRALTELCQERGHTFVPGYCRVSTLKPMTGHMHAASSLGALLKIIRSFQTKKIHKILDYTEPNEFCDMDNTPCRIARETENWEETPHARLAALHSYGAGGNNAHVLLEEFRPESFDQQDPCQTLICLSARTPEQLNQMMQRLHDYLAAAPKTDLANLSFTLNIGRTKFQHRCAMIVESIEELLSLLNKVNYPNVPLACYAGKVEKESIIDLSQQKEITLKKLAIEWVNGASIKHIELLYSDQRVQRLAGLPGYPFEKRCCWFENLETHFAKEPDRGPSCVQEHDNLDDDHNRVLEVIQKALGFTNEDVELETPFFDMGLTSTNLVTITQEIKDKIYSGFLPSMFFEYNTISILSSYLAKIRSDAIAQVTVTQNEGENLFQELKETPENHPLSEGQKGLWTLQKTFPDMTAYNVPLCFRILNLNVEMFKQACHFLLKQHPILNSVIRSENGVLQQLILPSQTLFFQQEDLRGVEWDQVQVHLNKLTKQVFILEKGPLLRIYLLSLSNKETIVLINVHHIVFDGSSVAILIKTLFEAYKAFIANKVPDLLSLPSYCEFVREEQHMLEDKAGKSCLLYWQQQLSGNLPTLSLLTDRPRSSSQSHFAGKTYSHVLSPDLSEQVKLFSKSQRIYFSTAFMSLFKVLLHRYTGEKDIIVGMPFNERNQKYLNNTIGFFINMVPIRSGISESESFVDFSNKLQRTIVDGLAHSYPFSALVRELNIPMVLGKSPVFQVAFLYQNFFEGVDSLELDFVEGVHQEGEYEIVLEVIEQKTGFVLNWKYNPELFDESTIVRMMEHYSKLLEDMCTDPNLALTSYSLLSNEEKKTLLLTWNDTQIEYPQSKCFHQLFEDQALRTPHAPAIVYEDQSLTYEQLDRKSTQLAKYLQSKGVATNVLVAICLERSLDMMIGLLGILKAGGAYLPLDPTYPAKRLAYMLEDSQAKFVITQSALKQKVFTFLNRQSSELIVLDEQWAKIQERAIKIETLQDKTRSDDLAYVIYTSGSTGQPKGVMIPHFAVTNFLLSMAKEPGLQQSDKLFAVTTYCFDIAGLELFLPLIKGAQCYISNAETVKNVEMLKECIRQLKPTIMQATPSTWTMLFHSGWRNDENIKILCGGDTLSESLKQYFIKTNSHAWNLYGPTETTIWSTVDKIENDKLTTIGKPIANTKVYILDQQRQLTPIGVPGELYIAGDGLAKGYLNKPALSAESFIDNPFNPGSKLYRTKDLARWLPDGRVQHLGRMDFQVKINGFRIELSEIENQLNSHSDVKESVVIVKEKENSKQLIAYYVPTQKENHLSEKLKSYLSEKLPGYMIPSFFIGLDHIPLTANGKIDRKELMQRDIILQKENTYSLPKSEIEREVLAIWKSVLEIESISTTDGFFEVGGNSVTAVILSERISKEFKVSFPTANVFKYSNVQKISQYINKEAQSSLSMKESNPTTSQKTIEGKGLKNAYPDYYKDSLAIIGISCHFPGAKNHGEFWQNIKGGKESTRFFSKEELRQAHVSEEMIQNPNYVPMQLNIDGKEFFDPAFFNLSSKNAVFMDPQFRQLLLHSWQAIEDAGYVSKEIPETSVFMSVSNSFYQTLLQNSNRVEESDEYINWILAQGGSIPTTISYQLGLKGPSIFVHTNCSSSLSAMSLAYQSLQSNDVKYALVGASTLFSSSNIGYIHRPGLNFSSDGRCKTFDASADGLIPGEGVGVLVLKRALDAIADGDHIYALLRGVGLNNDGSDKAGFYAPGVSGQVEVIQKVLNATKVNPESISYVEAHGTGTELGDPIEVSALTEAYQHYTSQKKFCALGSVKPNIGHLDTAAGLAGCIKVALSLKHKEIPPLINYTKPNPKINFEESPFYIVDHLQKWPKGASPRRAGLSSFGIGGTNAHAILEEYLLPENCVESKQMTNQGSFLVPLSAKNGDRLFEYAEKLLNFLRESERGTFNLRDLSYTLQVGREAMEKRLVFIVQHVDELIEKLEAFTNKKGNIKNCFQGEVKKGSNPIFFEDDEDAQELINKWLVKGKVEKLAKFWLEGGNFNWKLLYQDSQPKRISAPTYPFAKERYGIDTKSSSTTNATKVVTPSVFHENFPSLTTLLFKPIWKASPANSGGDFLRYTAHHVFLCGLKQPQVESAEMAFVTLQSSQTLLEKRFVDYSVALFEHIQTLLAEKPKGPVLLQVVVPDLGPERMYACLSGLLKSAHLENPRIFGQVIMVGAESAELIAKLQESSKYPQEQYIHYKSGNRFVMSFAEEIIFESDAKEMPWQEEGVYLITGGAGGLGLLFAKEIAEQTKQATLVITGRSKLTAKKQAQLKELESLGIKITYKEVDVCDKAAVENLIHEIEQECGQLNGIIHSAGIIKDNFILKKDKAEFRQVMLPKVEGVVNLDQATQNLRHLDFFILFSSVAGTTGNAGQADYATANAFLDAFAQERQSLCSAKKRSGQTVSINWPLWRAGGMSVDQATEQMMRESMGMVPMETTSGMAAFYLALSLKQTQVVVMEGISEKIKSFLLDKQIANSDLTKIVHKKIDLQILREKTLSQLKLLIGDVLKFSPSKIDPEEALEKYGIDSIAIIQLNQKLKGIFGEISRTLFFEYQTLAALCDYLIHEYSQGCVQWSGLEPEENTCSVKESFREALPAPTSFKQAIDSSDLLIKEENKIHESIAIIGISGRYPQAKDSEEYWQNLKSGRNSIEEIPKERWSLQEFYCADVEEAIAQDKSYSKWGGFLEGFSEFDPLFFGISPRETMNMDPQERIFIQSCWTLLEDAGYTKQSLALQYEGKVGVFAGITKTGFALYAPELRKREKPINPQTSFSSVANRVSYLFDLKGPSMAIDTMCSSSLTAIHEACEHLYRNECKMAIAGGVNLYLHPSTYVDLCALRMLSMSGQCKSFGEGADGFVPGEGVGVVLLKKLTDAVKDKDHIYAVIRGTQVNHGGKTNGYTVPNPRSHRELIRATLDKAKINARAVSYLEAHGTGTELGDPIEITGLTQAFQEDTLDTGFCSIGSAKSNIGHLEAAAGIAGVAKILYQMKHKTLVASLHAKKMNPNIDFNKTPFVVQQEPVEWRRPVIEVDGIQKEYPRIAGISSFGAGGSNAHAIIEEYTPAECPKELFHASHPVIIVLSAKNQARLNEYAKKLLKFIQSNAEVNLADLAYTFQVGREAMEERLGLIIHSKQELEEKLQSFIEKRGDVNHLYCGQVKPNKDALAIFTGSRDMAKTIDDWIANDKYGELLEIWVKGLNIDWNKLYKNNKPQRMSAPTYPFAKDRYWIEIENPQINNEVGRKHHLHPLLQENISRFSELRFRSTFTGKEFFFNNQTADQKILPGIAYLEMAQEAVKQAVGDFSQDEQRIHFKNVVWARPLIIEGSIKLNIELFLKKSGEIFYEIYTEDDNSEKDPVVNNQGIAFLAPSGASASNLLDLQTKFNCFNPSLQACQAPPENIAHPGINKIYRNEEGVLAKLALPASLVNTTSQFTLHPYLLDAALQAAMDFDEETTLSTSQISQFSSPFMLDHLEVIKGCTELMWAWIRRSNADITSNKLDVDLCDEQGHLIAIMRGLVCLTETWEKKS